MELITRWISLLLLGAVLADMPLAVVGVHSRNEFKQWQGKADVLQLKDGRILPGKIVEIKKNGVVFDPNKLSILVNPPPKFYPFSDIRELVRKDGRIVYPKMVPSEKVRPVYTLSVLGSHSTKDNSTYFPLAVVGQRLTQRSELTVTFAKSFNVDEGVGCCDCGGEIPPYSYRVHYSTYLWALEAKGFFDHGGFEAGVTGYYQERGWCDERYHLGFPLLPYAGFWGEPIRHVSVGIRFLPVPSPAALMSGVAWQSTDRFSRVWVGVIYFGERVPRVSDLRPSFRLQVRVRKNWLVHLRLYQFNQPYSSSTPRFLFVGIGRVFNTK
ncbi:MAG: hypothetical protein GXO76_02570 [Calditrichaeota bacterium]|nr:hypothetical protein [Calditrichota bacterium]